MHGGSERLIGGTAHEGVPAPDPPILTLRLLYVLEQSGGRLRSARLISQGSKRVVREQ